METNELNSIQPSEENENTEELTSNENAEALAANESDKKKKPRKSFWQELREWVVSLISAVVIVLILQNFVFTLIRVDGSSMKPTLLNGERLFVTVADVKFGSKLDRNSVVICHYPNRGRTFFVKRVVATPGDQVYREFGVTHVIYETTDESGNTITVDEPLDAEHVFYYSPDDDYEPYTLGADEYFVVGDNRGNSHDSRDWNDGDPDRDVGPITKDMIVGRVRNVIWPLSEIRTVE